MQPKLFMNLHVKLAYFRT
ncbi:hypothetical protein BpHYR1_022876 [Brachionus plicatilis]|uniref:Uncharacterized protein n=1 Tax=Brachionus plicatilis TaxID=10195 RepID=A0A3M7P497_BRAPC|nr:hypothetical protein BpHYR1_022876 [Brachionus plicatilis]